MLIVYFDEVKYQAGVQPFQWLAGVAVPGDTIKELEAELSALALTTFGSTTLEPDTEFHASRIFNGGAHFANTPRSDRLEILRELARILARFRQAKRIQVRIDVGKVYSSTWSPAELAFIFFTERANQLARVEKQPALLIGDFEQHSLVTSMVERYANYRSSGTPFPYGIRVDDLVDTVHFARSHHSRLLQLADAWAWFSQLPHAARADQEPRRSLIKFLRTDADIMWPDKYKVWPQ
jgi:hypothetical protein